MLFGTLVVLANVAEGALYTYTSKIRQENGYCQQNTSNLFDECMNKAIAKGEVYQEVAMNLKKLDPVSVKYNSLAQKGYSMFVNEPLLDVENHLNYSRWAAIHGNITNVYIDAACASTALLIAKGSTTQLIHPKIPSNGDFSELIDLPIWDIHTAMETFPTVNLDCTTFDANEVPTFEKCNKCVEPAQIGEDHSFNLTLARVWRNWHDLWDFKVIKGHESVALEGCETGANWRDYHGAKFLPGAARDDCLRKFQDTRSTVLVRGQLSKGLSSDLRSPLTSGSSIKSTRLGAGNTAYSFIFKLSGGINEPGMRWEITELGVSKKHLSCMHNASIYLANKALDSKTLSSLDEKALSSQSTLLSSRDGTLVHDFSKETLVLLRSGPLVPDQDYTIIVVAHNVCDDDVDPVLYTQSVIPPENTEGPGAITRAKNQIFDASVYEILFSNPCKDLDGMDISSLNATAFASAMEKIANSSCGHFTFQVKLDAPGGINPIGLSSKPQYVLPGPGSETEPLSEWFNESYTTRKDYYQGFSFIVSRSSAASISPKAIPKKLIIKAVDFRTTLSKHSFHPENCGHVELHISSFPQTTLFPYYPYERFSGTGVTSSTLGSTVFLVPDSPPIPALQTDQQFIMLPPKAKFDHDPTTMACLGSDSPQIVPTVVLESIYYTPELYKKDLASL